MSTRPVSFSRAFSSRLSTLLAAPLILAMGATALAQDELGQADIDDFDHNVSRDDDDVLLPWADLDRTTLTVPRVANGAVALDGSISSAEYGSFAGVEVVPVLNSWVLNFPNDRTWDGVDDSRFSFWLAHDDDFFYIAADVTDNVVNVDDPNANNWKDDSIEVLFDALNTKYDVADGANEYGFGGHDGIDASGRQRAWDYDAEAPNDYGNREFATGVDWTNGPDGDVHAIGVETDHGYAVEMRYAKRLFEDPDVGNKLENDYVMGFNIAVDDDDGRGPGPDGNGPGIQGIDEEVSYQWSHRERLLGWNEDEAFGFTEEEIADNVHLDFYDLGFSANGRLTQGALGEIIFSDEIVVVDLVGDCNSSGVLDAGDLSCVLTIEERDLVLGALNSLAGDLDGNARVEFADFLVLSANFGNESGTYNEGNVDLDAGIGFPDFLVLSANFGQTAGISAVPEPSAAASMCILASMFLFQLRRRTNSI